MSESKGNTTISPKKDSSDSKVKKEKSKVGSAVSGFIRKLSGGLMIPIALLPIAGLFLGIGAGFENVYLQASDAEDTLGSAAYIFTIFKMIGDLIFGNLPILFCLGVAIAFSNDVGVAVFTGAIAWIVFNATQSTLIWEAVDGDGNLVYDIGFYSEVPESVVTANIGITSMQTSVFGGILMGFWAAYMYNKFHEFEMPKILGFFSGTRFVPIITFLTVPIWGFIFVMIWPAIGIGLDYVGQGLGKVPYGFDALAFGIIERSLIPFGLHHAFYAPLWYTSVGGTLTGIGAGVDKLSEPAYGDQGMWFAFQTLGIPYSVLNNVYDGDTINDIAQLSSLDINWISNGNDEFAAINNWAGYDGLTVIVKRAESGATPELWATITEGMDPGQYQQGKFPFMLLGLPACGIAMIMAAKKENRELAMSVIGASALTAFLTGITEPIEFTFLFIAPYLYYGFHIWMAGISFFLLDILGSHVGMTFSGGIFDYVLFGILPDATGFHSNCWWIPIIGIIYAPIYYFFFYFMITKLDIKTPGRDDTGEVKMTTKDEFRKAKGIGDSNSKPKKSKSSKDEEFDRKLNVLVESLGGVDNLTNINACATKLRLQVVNYEIIDFDKIMKETGAFGYTGEKGNAPMFVYGVEAEKYKTALNKLKNQKKD